MFGDFLNLHKKGLEHEDERKKGYNDHPANSPLPHLAAVKDSMFIGRGGREGEEVGTGDASSWRTGEGRGSRKRKKMKK